MEKRIGEIIDRCKAIDVAQEAIESKANLENAGQFTVEQREEYTKLKTEFDTLIEEKKQLEADAAMRADRAGRAELLQPAVLPRRVAANSAAPMAAVTTISGTPIDRSNGNGPELDEFGRPKAPTFRVPARFTHFVPRNFKGVVGGRGPQERAYRFGAWCLHAISQCIPRYDFPEASRFVRDYIGAIQNAAHGEIGGTTGADFLVPEEFSADVIILRETYGMVRKLFGRSIMTTDIKHEPKRLTGLTAYFVGEGQAGTESNMTWQDIQLIAKDLMCLSRISNQLSMDAMINVGDTIAGEMAYAFTNKEDDCGFNGTGTSTYAGILGIIGVLLNADGAGTASAGLVSGTSTGWAGLVLGDFNKVIGTIPRYAVQGRNARWAMHQSFYGQVAQKLEAAAGGNTMVTIQNGTTLADDAMFLGFPVSFVQIMPSSTGTNVPCLFGDFGIGTLFGDRQQDRIDFSEHAVIGGQSVFENNQIAIRATERFDINVHGAGTTSVAGPIVGLKSN